MATAQTALKKPVPRTKAALRSSGKQWEFVAAPTHPGKMLRSKFMDPLGLTAEVLAARTAHPVAYVEALTDQRERITKTFAVALGEVLGTGPEVWLNLQQFTDDFAAKQAAR
jgi:addiction module HigA family antidote